MATKLSVNVNKLALLRNSREGLRPDIVGLSRLIIESGAEGITVHPRPDQRHIRPDDVMALAGMLRDEFPGIEYNIEGNPFAGPRDNGYPGFIELCEQAKPDQVTLVPDTDAQLTSDHGWGLSESEWAAGNGSEEETNALRELTARLNNKGFRVSLFMGFDVQDYTPVRDLGAARIELYTEPYAQAAWSSPAEGRASFDLFSAAATRATSVGLGINAGHDLDLVNLPRFAELPGLLEVSIGHALIADALELGLADTVRAYKALFD
jgi:pyridoxine 5-phosphate synthase